MGKVLLVILLLTGSYAAVVSFSKTKTTEETSGEVFKPKVVTKIGDLCDDKNPNTIDDLYIDTEGTCVGGNYKVSKLRKLKV